jgi:hypothetical protein
VSLPKKLYAKLDPETGKLNIATKKADETWEEYLLQRYAPMTEAPKDGTKIDIWTVYGYRIPSVKWNKIRKHWKGGGAVHYEENEALGWMPILRMPEVEE